MGIKPFVATAGAACNLKKPSSDVTEWWSYIVGNAGNRFLKVKGMQGIEKGDISKAIIFLFVNRRLMMC